MATEKKRILIFGASGFVGTSLAQFLSQEHQVFGTYRHELTRVPGVTYFRFNEIEDKDRVKDLASRCEPHIVIYCAGKNDIDYYEKDQVQAQLVFSGGAGGTLSGVETYKPKYIYLSSDHVFSGTEGNTHENGSTLAYTNIGKAKVGGETYIRNRSLNHVIIRAAPLLGRGTLDHPSWIDQMREDLFLGKEMKFTTQVFHNPIHISALHKAIKTVIDSDLKNRVLHVAGLTKATPFEVASLFASLFGYDLQLIKPFEDPRQKTHDFSMNFSESLKLLQTQPLFLEQSFDLLK